MNKNYIEQLCAQMKAEGLDALLICPSDELRFMLGFSPMTCERFQGLFLKAGGGLFYFCNLLYEAELNHAYENAVPMYTWFDGDVMVDAAAAALEKEGLSGKTIAVNASAQAFHLFQIMRRFDVTFVDGASLMEEARIIKSPQEIVSLRKSAGIADEAFNRILEYIRPGQTERDIFLRLAETMVELGGANPGALIASGPNSSYPHYQEQGRVIKEQDLVLLDYGCTYNGLRSDMSRTVFVGAATDEQKALYDLVLRANETAEKAAVTGAFIPDVDHAARNLIEQAGYGETLITRIGHGIGYMVHEAPDIKKSNARKLVPGMAFSIEPGVYLAGRFGIRIEDIVVTTETGNEVLNKAPKNLIIV